MNKDAKSYVIGLQTDDKWLTYYRTFLHFLGNENNDDFILLYNLLQDIGISPGEHPIKKLFIKHQNQDPLFLAVWN